MFASYTSHTFAHNLQFFGWIIICNQMCAHSFRLLLVLHILEDVYAAIYMWNRWISLFLRQYLLTWLAVRNVSHTFIQQLHGENYHFMSPALTTNRLEILYLWNFKCIKNIAMASHSTRNRLLRHIFSGTVPTCAWW